MPDYVLPALARAAADPEQMVRHVSTYAPCPRVNIRPVSTCQPTPRVHVSPSTLASTCHPPTLASTCQVRCALASHLGKLASTCQRFVEVSQWMRTASMHDGTDPAAALHSFDSELSALQEQVSDEAVMNRS